jgi:antitoxin component HigA of HigAB toxin-antitoxin module
MAIEGARDPRFLELVSEFPLTPIADDRSYRSAIKILDRLFDRDDHRTASEVAYFLALAILASEYEHKQQDSSPITNNRPREESRVQTCLL